MLPWYADTRNVGSACVCVAILLLRCLRFALVSLCIATLSRRTINCGTLNSDIKVFLIQKPQMLNIWWKKGGRKSTLHQCVFI